MPLFACTKCNCIENTALAGYWIEMMTASREKRAASPQCSECITGKWHGRFEKQSAVGMLLASDGFIYAADEVEREKRRFAAQGIRIVRTIGELDTNPLHPWGCDCNQCEHFRAREGS